MNYQDMMRMPVAQRTDKQYMDWYLEVQEGKNAEELGKLRNLMEQDIVYFEASTRLKSRDSRTCKQAHLKSNSSFTIAGGPLQV